MSRHLTQIVMLLMTYVAVNYALEEQCPAKSIKPVDVPPEYVLGTWRAKYCTDSSLCSPQLRCMEYHYNTTDDGKILLNVRGHNENTNQTMETKGTVKFTGRTGEFIVEDMPGFQSIQFLMLHAERHFCVLYGCITDKKGITTYAAFISTKNDPDNELTEHELARAISVCARNRLSFGEFMMPPYHDCEEVNKMSADPQALRDMSM